MAINDEMTAEFLSAWNRTDRKAAVLLELRLRETSGDDVHCLRIASEGIEAPSPMDIVGALDANTWWAEGIIDPGTISSPGGYLASDVSLCSVNMTINPHSPVPAPPAGGVVTSTTISGYLKTHIWIGAEAAVWVWEKTLKSPTTPFQVFKGEVQTVDFKDDKINIGLRQRVGWNQQITPKVVTREEFTSAPEESVGAPIPVYFGRIQQIGMRLPFKHPYSNASAIWQEMRDNTRTDTTVYRDTIRKICMNGAAFLNGGKRLGKAVLVDVGHGGARGKVAVSSNELAVMNDIESGCGLYFDVGDATGLISTPMATASHPEGGTYNGASGAGFYIYDPGDPELAGSGTCFYPMYPTGFETIGAHDAYNCKAILDKWNDANPVVFLQRPEDYYQDTLILTFSAPEDLGPIAAVYLVCAVDVLSGTLRAGYSSTTAEGVTAANLIMNMNPEPGTGSSGNPVWFQKQIFGGVPWENLGGMKIGLGRYDRVWTGGDPNGQGGIQKVYGCGLVVEYTPNQKVIVQEKRVSVTQTRPGKHQNWFMRVIQGENPSSTYTVETVTPAITESAGKFYAHVIGQPDDESGTYTGSGGLAIVAGVNDVLSWIASAGALTVNLRPGLYGISSILKEIYRAMGSAGGCDATGIGLTVVTGFNDGIKWSSLNSSSARNEYSAIIPAGAYDADRMCSTIKSLIDAKEAVNCPDAGVNVITEGALFAAGPQFFIGRNYGFTLGVCEAAYKGWSVLGFNTSSHVSQTIDPLPITFNGFTLLSDSRVGLNARQQITDRQQVTPPGSDEKVWRYKYSMHLSLTLSSANIDDVFYVYVSGKKYELSSISSVEWYFPWSVILDGDVEWGASGQAWWYLTPDGAGGVRLGATSDVNVYNTVGNCPIAYTSWSNAGFDSFSDRRPSAPALPDTEYFGSPHFVKGQYHRPSARIFVQAPGLSSIIVGSSSPTSAWPTLGYNDVPVSGVTNGLSGEALAAYEMEGSNEYRSVIERPCDLARWILEKYGQDESINMDLGSDGSFVAARRLLKTWRGSDMIFAMCVSESTDVMTVLSWLASNSCSWITLSPYTDMWNYSVWGMESSAPEIIPADFIGSPSISLQPSSKITPTISIQYGYDNYDGSYAHNVRISTNDSIAGYEYYSQNDQSLRVSAGVNDKLEIRGEGGEGAYFTATLDPGDHTFASILLSLTTRFHEVYYNPNPAEGRATVMAVGFGGVACAASDLLIVNGVDVIIPSGIYSMTDYAAAVQGAIIESTGEDDWVVRYAYTTKKFNIYRTTDGPAVIDFVTYRAGHRHAAACLGLRPKVYTFTGYSIQQIDAEPVYEVESRRCVLSTAEGRISVAFRTGPEAGFDSHVPPLHAYSPLGFVPWDDTGMTSETYGDYFVMGRVPKGTFQKNMTTAVSRYINKTGDGPSRKEMAIEGRTIYDTDTALEIRDRLAKMLTTAQITIKFSSEQILGLDRGRMIEFAPEMDVLFPFPDPDTDGSWVGKQFIVVETEQHLGPDAFFTEVVAVYGATVDIAPDSEPYIPPELTTTIGAVLGWSEEVGGSSEHVRVQSVSAEGHEVFAHGGALAGHGNNPHPIGFPDGSVRTAFTSSPTDGGGAHVSLVPAAAVQAAWDTIVSGSMTECRGTDMVLSTDGDVIVVFSGIPPGGVRGLYCHKIRSNGTATWEAPVALRQFAEGETSSLPENGKYFILPDTEGGAYVFWSELSTDQMAEV